MCTARWLNGMSEIIKTASAPALANKPRLVSIPPMLATLRSYVQEALQPLLRVLFDKMDDHFFELAEKAKIDAEQKIYFKTKKEIRSKRYAIETSCLANINEMFYLVPEIVTHDRRASAEKRIDDISIDTPLFSVLVAFDEIVAKNNAQMQTSLEKVTKQINKLFPEYKLDQYNSPLGIYSVTQIFLWSCDVLMIEPEERIIVLNLFDKYVLRNFEKILTKASQLLLDSEIATLVATKQASDQASKKKFTNAASTTSTKNKETIKKQTREYREQKNNLCSALFNLQKSCFSEVSSKNVQDMADLVKNEAYTLKIDDDSVLGNELQQAMTLIRMLSSFVLSESGSPDLQTWINQLYIPLLKTALIDITVFSSTDHAVRRLLNEIVKAAADIKADSTGRHDLFRRYIVQVIDRIVKEFDQDISLFPELLVDFKTAIDDERKRQSIINARLGDGDVSIARSVKAQVKIDKTIAIISKGKPVPLQIMDFLNESWRLVLTLAYLTGGDKSAGWVNAVQTAETLIDSVLPTSRMMPILKLEKLLTSLKVGLAGTGFTSTEIRTFLAALEALHLRHYQSVRACAEARLATKLSVQLSEVIVDPIEVPVLDSVRPNDAEMDVELLQTKTLPLEDEVSDASKDKRAFAVQCASDLKVDMWLEFYSDAHQKKRVKIAAILHPSQKFIFVDRDGKKIIEKTIDEVVDAIESGELKLLDANSMFGKALLLKR